jgi:6-phosphogluconate dehydrogenase
MNTSTQATPQLQLTIVGLGRMGANLARRISRNNKSETLINISVYDVNAETVTKISAEGFTGLSSIIDLANYNNSENPQIVWVMVPAEVTGVTIRNIAEHLGPGSILIDGGNTFYRDDLANAAWLATKGINFVDVGTSGGVFGLERGYSLMIGGDENVVQRLRPIFTALAPGVESAERTPGKTGDIADAEQGFFHCGPAGAGHFVKMVHNGIEYGAMAAYAEGLNLLQAASQGIHHPTSVGEISETKYELDLEQITEVWRRGSVVASWLLDLTAQAYAQDPQLSEYGGSVADSGEGRWTVQTAIDAGIPVNVLSASLMGRFSSRGNDLYANKILSAMRKKFGGHIEVNKTQVKKRDL